MITEKIIREQTPDVGFDWLYEEQSDGTRNFARRVLLGIHAVEWLQCTDADKTAYEEEQRKKADELAMAEQQRDLEAYKEREAADLDTQEDLELLPNNGVTDVDA